MGIPRSRVFSYSANANLIIVQRQQRAHDSSYIEHFRVWPLQCYLFYSLDVTSLSFAQSSTPFTLVSHRLDPLRRPDRPVQGGLRTSLIPLSIQPLFCFFRLGMGPLCTDMRTASFQSAALQHFSSAQYLTITSVLEHPLSRRSFIDLAVDISSR